MAHPQKKEAATAMPRRVTIGEVGPRDGFQMEKSFIPTDRKIEIIDALSRTGIPVFETTSFVHPRAIPQLRDAEEVMTKIKRAPGVKYSALVPNAVGARRAVASGVDEIHVVVSASNTHNRNNVNMTVDESLKSFEEVMEIARPAGVPVKGGIGTAFGCPYEGDVPEEQVLRIIERMLAMGMAGITVADSTGMANPLQVKRLVGKIKDRWPDLPLVLHLHNTRGMGLANALAGLQAGVTELDASIGGMGGCPYAPGATGNISTEDLVHMLHEMGIETGIDLDALIACARLTQEVIGHPLDGQVMKAGKRLDLYPIPEKLKQKPG